MVNIRLLNNVFVFIFINIIFIFGYFYLLIFFLLLFILFDYLKEIFAIEYFGFQIRSCILMNNIVITNTTPNPRITQPQPSINPTLPNLAPEPINSSENKSPGAPRIKYQSLTPNPSQLNID